MHVGVEMHVLLGTRTYIRALFMETPVMQYNVYACFQR